MPFWVVLLFNFIAEMDINMAELKYLAYVDDDEDDRELLSELFKAFSDYKLHTYANGYDLLDWLESSNDKDFPCLIILDINMPRLNGIDLLSLLKSHSSFCNIPVVLFSTGLIPYNKTKVLELKTDVISKPASISGYHQTCKALLSYCG